MISRSAFRRLAAFAIDWVLLALWGGALFGVVLLTSDGELPQPPTPWRGQLIGFVTMTLPFTLYFAVCEASRHGSTLGKRVVRLRVEHASGGRLSFGRAFARNALKFLPWECGHTIAQQAADASSESFPLWLWPLALVAMLGPLVWLCGIFISGVTRYDRWTSSRVVSRRSA